MVYDNSDNNPIRIRGTMKKKKVSPENKRFFDSVKRAMPAAARRARKIARMYGTTIVVWENGKIVEKKP
jgi:Ni,Fe-hydrogenase III component G